jgi:hypothetical protein
MALLLDSKPDVFRTILVLTSAVALVSSCATSRTDTSMKVAEYASVEEMSQFSACESLGVVTTEYSVLMHSPPGRKRAASVRLRDAAHAKGANAVIMTVNDWGVTTDQVTGMAYLCAAIDTGDAAMPTEQENTVETRLQTLKKLHRDGLISAKEYEVKRAEILEEV